ncbi:fumarylacetoacetate hydrolase family protein [Halopseudomonas aestusnigri]|jgi:2-keto-4-pentenoate hydratase/2-oxohepta-3-ene-1,7-dioic acid hydratase in catechol pathway|uniref:fumarylacetoacetate hydrolase family protein n=1 Tax=Halopseudomonas TaxID=2901189 RepID=UPI001E5FD2F2|nr:fumarylacetoacetate hydrolase family protein [Halopseudomonas aestusnigri]MCK5531351.1 fumarylacetoacetate hydrolase family protein [Halopseudomonas aestusnigri]MEE2800014.1 fumarylacetoacetate hydrolase family protein [Pseudomonadota bacterium]UGV31205.1 fumarylacetoacetate hydrolase family protein [Halopseudomonas aestusnigri]|tara:strand:- start:929 stop:1597 length:669 start_codon:yes stop_codon:yes gene_type:complete
MTYQHQYVDGSVIDLPMGKVVCVGRNYAEHARELNNPVPTEPLLFIKPATSVVPMAPSIKLVQGRGPVHYETEIALLIGAPLSGMVSEEEAEAAIIGVGLALDLTLRELQDQLKAKSHPWERAKAFDGACPLSPFVPKAEAGDLHALSLQLDINGERRQQGSAAEMITPIVALVRHIANQFSLLPGDVVITGTPAGVGVLNPGDELTLAIAGKLQVQTRIAE